MRHHGTALGKAVLGKAVLGELVHDVVADALAILAPVECAGCGAPDRGLCALCHAELRPEPGRRLLEGARAPLPVWSSLDYAGAARSVLLAYKEGGRTDAAGSLAPVLGAAVGAALAGTASTGWTPHADGVAGPVALAIIPSSRDSFRRRGYHPTALVLRRAGLRPSGVLSAARQTEDQAGLDLAERAWNRDGSLRASRFAQGRAFLIVDDILTTGATVREARRALESAGGAVLGAATIAATRRRDGSAGRAGNSARQSGDFHAGRVYGR